MWLACSIAPVLCDRAAANPPSNPRLSAAMCTACSTRSRASPGRFALTTRHGIPLREDGLSCSSSGGGVASRAAASRRLLKSFHRLACTPRAVLLRDSSAAIPAGRAAPRAAAAPHAPCSTPTRCSALARRKSCRLRLSSAGSRAVDPAEQAPPRRPPVARACPVARLLMEDEQIPSRCSCRSASHRRHAARSGTSTSRARPRAAAPRGLR